ncbi:hypothetical protein [Phenylobacterium sp.]|uniref:hypothetical protein n=1 Tax=Phenylobacterium sp. TaxID=1871053 RepID=UPI001226FC91|nr:hypothetical protein [Phenylobacterium sp.]THD62567.1 MAG: hypothetical protein E8A49_07260 [Phenylobacterium sp.]
MKVHHIDPAAVAAAVRARQLMAEARSAAFDNLTELVAALETARTLSDSVAAGGELYGVGLRDLASRLSEDLLGRGRSLQALADRERRGLLAH